MERGGHHAELLLLLLNILLQSALGVSLGGAHLWGQVGGASKELPGPRPMSYADRCMAPGLATATSAGNDTITPVPLPLLLLLLACP